MKKILGGAGTLAAAGLILLAGGQSASAAAGSESAQGAPVGMQEPWRYVDWYWTYGNCASNGGQLVARGEASNWRCDQSPYATFYLYVI
ncbi:MULTISPECIES: hypothetical protein [Amycolatopsis]|uniref:Secreted protein n=1 Tax=Amycolatopsis bullii TaxID=941987 RepID=A0ABQ3KUA0_9PSEU|nr:hypothetical protein [Amycolatopsis bullii]GHG49670.1 hypothetical protein GCM10017567_85460 [Amycolatopsis bullii]